VDYFILVKKALTCFYLLSNILIFISTTILINVNNIFILVWHLFKNKGAIKLKRNTEHINNLEEETDSVIDHYGYLDHLLDELKLLDLKLMQEIQIAQNKDREDFSSSKGLYISVEEVLSSLNPQGKATTPPLNNQKIDSIRKFINSHEKEIGQRLFTTKDSGDFPLLRLQNIFGITPFEMSILIMAAAVEIDKKYEKIYSYINNDITRKLPTAGLVLDIFCDDEIGRLSAQQYFSADATLFYFDILHFVDTDDAGSFSGRRFRLDERIRRFLLGDNGISEALLPIVKVCSPGECVSELNSRSNLKDNVLRIITDNQDKDRKKAVFWLYGNGKEEKKFSIQSLCTEVGLPLLTIDLQDILVGTDYVKTLRNIFREACLQSAMILFNGGECLYSNNEKVDFFKRIFFRTISEMSYLTLITADTLWMPEDNDGNYQWYPFEFRLPEYTERKKIWADALSGSKIPANDIDTLSARFIFSEGQIRNAVLSATQSINISELAIDSIYKACAIQSNQKLSIYSKRVLPHYTWDDIVLPLDKIRQLKEVCSHIKHKHIVHFNWGFAGKLALGKGLNILFSGHSGTGKTMTADIIANDLHLDMYKVDLSSIVSKYIGETEKNLNRIFKETSSGNMILFFDEADALFGKRSEVKDAHDRYANIEINYLLQKLEEHEGIVIMASNLSKNIDSAFQRRMNFIIDFPFPNEEMRRSIWENIFPEDAPMDDIDFELIASKFKLTGGNIKNISLHAAFLAADSGNIKMEHIMNAIKWEYQKMGHSISNDFLKFVNLEKNQ
jgi:ATP-dependent 26S proteasome regulatory subunit